MALLVAPFAGSESIRRMLAPGSPILVSASMIFPRMTCVGVCENTQDIQKTKKTEQGKNFLITRNSKTKYSPEVGKW
jgi:hypothetical protein